MSCAFFPAECVAQSQSSTDTGPYAGVVVSAPLNEGTASEAQIVEDALSASFDSFSKELGLKLGKPGDQSAGLKLHIKDGRIWFVRADNPWITTRGALGETPNITIPNDVAALAEDIRSAMWTSIRADKLLYFASQKSDETNASGMSVTAELRRYKQPAKRISKCDGAPFDTVESVSLRHKTTVSGCDRLKVWIRNDTDFAYYSSAFYVDSNGGVTVLGARVGGCVRLISPSDSASYSGEFMIWDDGAPSSIGLESIVIISVPEDSSKITPSMCSLEQASLWGEKPTRSMTREGIPSGGNLKLYEPVGAVSEEAVSEGAQQPPQVFTHRFLFDVRP